ncbi:fatty acid desaturase 4, chloroplastic-like [Tasmannia lanceolata]|uniref:fatty acid desaturase 4, chloroplastic-like n=1 Tax=Tasmannia lanceolata TaxID=3420 RepID=UPI0040637FE0
MPSSMPILPQQWRPLRLSKHLHTRHLHNISPISSTTPTSTRRQNPTIRLIDPYVRTSPVLANTHYSDDPKLQSTWTQRLWVASGSASILFSLAKSITASMESDISLEPLLAGLIGYIMADLGTGIYHWGIDNYGDGSTPLCGSQIEAFQGHHKWPWIITRRQFANNLHAIARPITFVVLPMDLLLDGGAVHAFVGVCSGCIMFSQQFHAWAHGTKSRLPRLVVALQDVGVLISRARHAAHHRPPYNNNYCIVSGVWNEFLGKLRFFEAMEMVIFFRFGVRPRSWSEPDLDWIEEASAPLP